MLVSSKEILEAAQKGGFAVIAPNANNETFARAAIEAAEECHTAVILDVNFPQHPDIVSQGRIYERLAMQAKVPVAIQQDHGGTFEQAIWAIRAGFTGIMADRSDKPYEQNVEEVAELVKIAHAVGVSVEGEIGHVGMGDDEEGIRAGLVDPNNCKDYVERTGVDALAIAIGTTHGQYKGTPFIDFDLLKQCREKVDIPLVLHGGSGTGDELLAQAARSGISKINICTDLLTNAADKWNEAGVTDAGKGMKNLKAGYKEKVIHYMHVFGQVDKF
ncbi:class II fructose-bisphosphate aldolase [Floccifex sp.]|uniref:class II fructose-bisphosphate aldolase n=1 Tax=Floccifex sp. TaxID=2815810 RepID=UPI003EF383F7